MESVGSIPALVITQAEEVSSKAWWETTWLYQGVSSPLLFAPLSSRRFPPLFFVQTLFLTEFKALSSSWQLFFITPPIWLLPLLLLLLLRHLLVLLVLSRGLCGFYCCNYALSLPPVIPLMWDDVDVFRYRGCFTPTILNPACVFEWRDGERFRPLWSLAALILILDSHSLAVFFSYGCSFYQHISCACRMHM